MIPCPACKPTLDEHEAENSYGFDWDSHDPRPKKTLRKPKCKVCLGTGTVQSYEFGTREIE